MLVSAVYEERLDTGCTQLRRRYPEVEPGIRTRYIRQGDRPGAQARRPGRGVVIDLNEYVVETARRRGVTVLHVDDAIRGCGQCRPIRAFGHRRHVGGPAGGSDRDRHAGGGIIVGINLNEVV